MKGAIFAAIAGAAVLLAATSSPDVGSKTVNVVSEKVRVESRNGKVLVRVTVDNQSDRTVFVPKAPADDDELFGPLFEVRDSSNGDPLEYTGPMVKRGPIGKDDFIAVKPRSVHSNTVDITRAYGYIHGKHTYQLSYQGTYLADLKNIDQATQLQVEPVLFSHTRP